ncbi:MAG: hypothetical protein MHMPM18_001522 [Marteilia pararefringens]
MDILKWQDIEFFQKDIINGIVTWKVIDWRTISNSTAEDIIGDAAKILIDYYLIGKSFNIIGESFRLLCIASNGFISEHRDFVTKIICLLLQLFVSTGDHDLFASTNEM